MPARANAFLALWNDVDSARVAEYEAWHTQEHVPERVASPGFLEGCRYRAAERATQRYFTLYTLETLAALRTPRYAEVVERPTPWSQRMRPALRDFRRYACEVVLRTGRGRGGAIATLVADAEPPLPAASSMTPDLTPFADAGGVVAIRLGAADTTTPFPLAAALKGAPTEGSPRVLLVEALDRAAADACMDVIEALWRSAGASVLLRASYDLVFVESRADGAGAVVARPVPRDDLFRRWSSR